ncbi:MAG: DEAD/DEAH box helicase [Fusobacteriaceae bacterium]
MKNSDKSIYFMLKNDEVGAYVAATSNTGEEIVNIEEWLVEKEWLQLPEIDRDILNFISKTKKKELFGEWEDVWGENFDFTEDLLLNKANYSSQLYIIDEVYLVELLLKSEKFVDENLKKIQYAEVGNTITLNIMEDILDTEYLKGELLLNEQYLDFITIDDSYAFRNMKFYKLNIKNDSMYGLENLKIRFHLNELESILTIFMSSFKNVSLNCLDYTVEEGAKKTLLPQIIIEKISLDNSLYMKVIIMASTMSYEFLTEKEISKIALVNTMEKKIVCSPVDLGELENVVQEIVKSLIKHQKKIKIKGAYFLDEDNLFILQEKLAKEFIGKELLKLATKYKIIGTEELKKYNIRTVRPKIIGSFKHSINFLEGNVDIDIEGEKFSILDVLSTYKTDSYITLSDGTNALINYRYIEKLERLFKDGDGSKVKISFFDLPIIEEMIDDKIFSQEFKKSRDFFQGINSVSEYKTVLPEIKATLREYQEYGYKWLSYLIDNNLGGCLADDMGLGKTLQAIALLTRIHLEKTKASLVVMPKSLIYNWENEIKKFSPGLKTGIYYGNTRDMSILNDKDVILTTYGTIRNDIEKLRKEKFELIILDESQNIKNVNAQTTKAIMLLNSKNRLALSGTPIENNLSELYSLFRFLNPAMFGSLDEFNMTYANPIQRDNDKEAIQELKKKIYPFILRRVKKEVLKDLPEKIEQTLFIEMNKEQKMFYEERRMYYYNMVNNHIKEQGLGKAQFYVLQALNELRQITSCPESKNINIVSSKRVVLINNVADAVANGHKVLVFTNYINSIENVCKDLDKFGIKYLSMTGATKDRQSLVDKFQKDSSYKVFVMTLKTGGVGLNLTSADTIFIYDPWWNKTVENQAVDRAYRLGQDRTVFSYKLILKDSIEEKILKLQELKSELLDNLISEDNSSVKFLTEKDIQFILGD